MQNRFPFVLLLAILASLFLTCALRTNPFDPQSPNPRPPELTVEISYDPTKVDEIRQDTIFAKSPFYLSVTVSSRFSDDSKDLPVSLKHFYNYNSNSESLWNNFTADTITLIKGGLHRFLFETEARNGVTKTTERIFVIDEEIRPSIALWTSSRDSFPYTPVQDDRPTVKLYTIIYDPDSLVDSIVLRPCWYNPAEVTIPTRTPMDMVRADDGTLSDTFPFSPSFDIAERSPFCISETFACYTQLFLYHKMGLDSVGKNFYFYDTLIYRGSPPRINEITTDPSEKIIERTDILFFADVTESNTHVISFQWNFGDSSSAVTTTQSVVHRYSQKGNYDLTLAVKDDSGNVVFDTLSLEVQAKTSAPPLFELFEVSNDKGSAPLKVKITAIPVTGGSLDTIVSLTFDFGDGSEPVTPPIPKTQDWPHTYDKPGNYLLYATAVDNKNRSTTTSHSIIVTED